MATTSTGSVRSRKTYSSTSRISCAPNGLVTTRGTALTRCASVPLVTPPLLPRARAAPLTPHCPQVKAELKTLYNLSDYWGKVPPKKAKEAVGEGMQSGISICGDNFIAKNPTQAERDEIKATHQSVDWSLWPAPPEEDDDSSDFVLIRGSTICDNSKQNPFSRRQVMVVQYSALHEALPWIESIYSQADHCNDYHSTQGSIARRQIGLSTATKLPRTVSRSAAKERAR